MNEQLRQMLESAASSKQLNEQIKVNRQEVKEHQKLERQTTSIDLESREVQMIQSLGLEIDLFEPADPNASEYDAHEYYYCSNHRWQVTIRNLLYDADLGTVLQVLDLTDNQSGDTIHYYCDLWNQNTPESRQEGLKRLLTMDKQSYIDEQFSRYYNLPKLLRGRGYDVKEENFTFDGDKCLGKLIITNDTLSQTPCEMAISHYHGVSTSVSEPKKTYSFDRISYPFTYESQADLDTLCQTIDDLLLHAAGKIGYLENGIYHSNKEVERFFNEYKNTFSHLHDATESYGYLSDDASDEEWEEYRQNRARRELSKINGVELHKRYELSINHDAYHFGGVDNAYTIIVDYHTQEDPRNCVLTITHERTQYYGHNNLLDEDRGFDENVIETTSSEFETRGTYSDVIAVLKPFLDELKNVAKK